MRGVVSAFLSSSAVNVTLFFPFSSLVIVPIALVSSLASSLTAAPVASGSFLTTVSPSEGSDLTSCLTSCLTSLVSIGSILVTLGSALGSVFISCLSSGWPFELRELFKPVLLAMALLLVSMLLLVEAKGIMGGDIMLLIPLLLTMFWGGWDGSALALLIIKLG